MRRGDKKACFHQYMLLAAELESGSKKRDSMQKESKADIHSLLKEK